MNLKHIWHRNSSLILSCASAAGVIATAVLVAKSATKISKIQNEREKQMDAKEKIAIYGPAILVCAGTICCILGANVLNHRRQVSLASAYALMDSSFKKYKSKLKELYGEEAHEHIVDSIAIEKATEKYIACEHLGSYCDLSIDENKRPVLFYEEFSDRLFESTIEQVMSAEYHLNRNYILRGVQVINEFYDFLGLDPIPGGDDIGWVPMDEGMFWIDFNHRKSRLEDGTEFYIIEMPFGPIENLDEIY